MPPVALSIAGSDPSGGAGIQADLKTFHQFGVYGEAVITLLTVQNTTELKHVEILPAGLVFQQIDALLRDIPPQAVKTGALGSAEIVEAVARALRGTDCPLVVDPVTISKHGAALLQESAVEALRSLLLPRAALFTPNIPEAAGFSGVGIESLDDVRRAAGRLHEMGAQAVLIKGGHLTGDAIDLLSDGSGFREFRAPRIVTSHTHGVGCTYSAAIAAGLALGRPLADAVAGAKRYIQEAIRTAPGLGCGSGPVNHHSEVV
jgi:hydroxymethylpyrimidine/phosphomethylpyrimidine kinase